MPLRQRRGGRAAKRVLSADPVIRLYLVAAHPAHVERLDAVAAEACMRGARGLAEHERVTRAIGDGANADVRVIGEDAFILSQARDGAFATSGDTRVVRPGK